MPNSQGHEGRLSPELTSLIHHVELHQSGWWEQALDRLVLAVVWRHSSTGDAEQLARDVSRALGSAVTTERVLGIVERMLDAGWIVQLPSGELKVAEKQRQGLQDELDAVTEADFRVRDRLIQIAADTGVDGDPDELWYDLEDLFVLPLVRSAGARMYEVLMAGCQLDTSLETYNDLAEPMCAKYGPAIRDVLVDFFDPADQDVRNYVLRMVNSAFVREAAGLGEDVLTSLRDSNSRPNRVRVFVDTNFLFSFLELHDNPSNQSASDLVELARRTRSSVAVDFYVLPITVNEMRRVLHGVIARLSGVLPRRNLANAAREVGSSGLVKRYLEAASKHEGGVLTADQFFGPYESGLVQVLRDRGVELYNDKLEPLQVDQEVVDDIHAQTDHQKAVREKGPKPYEANLHDMVLWHFVDRARPAVSDSPFEVGDWVVTVDYGLISFDRHKRRGTSEGVPVCVTPVSLIQLLQFWAPRTPELERALVGAMREPLLFLGFDGDSEQVTLRILRAISRFENVGDLSQSSIVNVLTNQALRSRLETAEADDQSDAEAVESAVVDEARRLEREVEQARQEGRTKTEEAIRQIEEKDDELAQLREALEGRDEEIDGLRQQAERRDEQSAAANELDERARANDDLVSRLEALELKGELRERRRTVALGVMGPILLAVALVLGGGLLVAPVAREANPGQGWVANSAVIAVFVLLWLAGVEQMFTRWAPLSSSRLAVLLRRFRKGYVAAAGAILLSIAAALVSEGLRD